MDIGSERVLKVLRAELRFLERGGYHAASHGDWRPHLIFEDSPTCPNSDDRGRKPSNQALAPCTGCALFSFIPAERRKEHSPCRHIVLNECGETIDSLYRQGTEEELELAVLEWLRNTIQALNSEVGSLPPTSTENRPPKKSVAATAWS